MARSSRGRKAGSPWRVLWGAGIAAVGFSVGLVAGSVLEGPRLLLEWLRGPVRSVEIEVAQPAVAQTDPLPGVSGLHRPAASRSPARRSGRVAASGSPQVAAARAPEPPAAAARTVAPASAPPRPPVATPAVPAGGVTAALRKQVESRPVAKPRVAPAAVPAPQRALVVQVASTPDSAEAQRIVARLRASGFDAFSVAVRPNGIATHRVRVRTAREQTPAALADRLRAQGFETWITRD